MCASLESIGISLVNSTNAICFLLSCSCDRKKCLVCQEGTEQVWFCLWLQKWLQFHCSNIRKFCFAYVSAGEEQQRPPLCRGEMFGPFWSSSEGLCSEDRGGACSADRVSLYAHSNPGAIVSTRWFCLQALVKKIDVKAQTACLYATCRNHWAQPRLLV